MNSVKNILILLAHPAMHKSRVNRYLLEEAIQADGVTVRDLYAKYPDYHINIKKEQNLLLQHDIIIWQHPFYWYSAPSLLKEWIDLVLEHEWAHGRNGTHLKGKIILSTITTGGTQEAYTFEGHNRAPISNFLLPYKYTARLCHMHYLPPFVVHGTHLLKNTELKIYGKQYKQLLTDLRNEKFSEEELNRVNYLNDLTF